MILVSLPTKHPLTVTCVSEAENDCFKRRVWKDLSREEEYRDANRNTKVIKPVSYSQSLL